MNTRQHPLPRIPQSSGRREEHLYYSNAVCYNNRSSVNRDRSVHDERYDSLTRPRRTSAAKVILRTKSVKAAKLLGVDEPTGKVPRSHIRIKRSHSKRKKKAEFTDDYDKRFRGSKMLEGAHKFEDHAREWENYHLGSFIGVVNEVIALKKKEKELKIKYVVLPDSTFRKVWDAILITCLVTYDDISGWLTFFIIDRITDVIFFTDIIINFRSPFVNYKGEIHFNAEERAREYLSTWFSIDLISIIPFDYFATFLPTSGPTTNNNLLKLPRLLRMFRLTKILKVVVASRIFKRYEMQISIKYGWIRLIKFAGGMLLLTHWMACFVYLAAILSGPQTTWLTAPFGIQATFTQDHWLGDAYVAAIYWAAMTITTIGYGDIVPVNSLERGLFILMMFVGACMYAYVVGTMCQLVEGLNVNTLEFQRRMVERL
ncbi:voltage-gated ion channel superfamily [Thraustotheca clavata]|uniref:Voltage-gated ion channel superfamily n=1 Tax=Thraustotheca clavata TaxID=74557 RepID=A0A1V9Y7X9_9STRA|nr:voltage-gated ion channel superfamily [Thraustotheca clavata]